jgi:hypothetical protein
LADGRKWVITTTPERISAVAQELPKVGLRVEQELGEIGVIIGVGEASAAEEARRIPGVDDVTPDAAVDIGPPGSEETW